MNTVEKLEEFYQRKFEWMPPDILSEIGHFNVFELAPLVEGQTQPLPYRRRDFYKIMLISGTSRVHYADQVVEVCKQALTFSNPLIPYSWEHLDQTRSGFYCIFNQQFFHQFGSLNQYAVFQPGGQHVFELNDDQVKQIQTVFASMLVELASDYVHKYDVLRNLVFGLLHFAMKMQPSSEFDSHPMNASQRISTLFMELLERQFPIEENHPQVELRTASAFARQLHVHVNHLNRALKETTQKTTTQIIAERILQEAKVLLKHSHWNVSKIAFALGFSEVTHFNNFFKKHTQTNPLKFRKD